MSKQIEEAFSIWGIYHKPKERWVKFGTKVGWNGSGPARRAFLCHTGVSVDDCPDFEVVNLSESYHRLEGLEK